MKGCKLCEMFDYQQQQQQQQKLLLKSGLAKSASKLHTSNSRLLNYCSRHPSATKRRSSTGSSGGSTCDSGSPSISSASSSSSLLSVPSPTTSLPSPVAAATAATAVATAASLNGPTTAANTATNSTVRHSSVNALTAASFDQQSYAILQPHFRDTFYATHLLRGYYQPAGPLISPHVLPTVPPTNSSLVVSTKQISSPIDSDRDQLQQLQQQQQHQSVQSTGDSQDNDVLITGGDLSTFRYPSQHLQQQQQHSQPPSQQSQSLSALSTVQQQQVPQPPPQNSPYARPLHPMHYTTAYPTSYYSPYPGDAMCYSPPYQPYFPAKVYQSAPAYRRYSSYYQPGPPPPPPNELYEGHPQSVASTNAQPPPPQVASQLVPTGPGGPQHIEHYPGPPGYYPNYNPGGGQCYSRSMQPPYMEYSAPCPCPMQTCPKNVLTGPLIGSNNSGSSNNSNNNSSSSNTMNNITANNTTSSSNITTTNNNSSLNNLNQQLKSNKGPVIMHNHLIGQHEQSLPPPPASNLPNGQSIHPPPPSSHHHRHHLQCKMELIEPLKTEIKSDVITDKMNSPESRKTGQYEETVVPPTPPSVYTVNDKLTEPDETVSPARGSAGLPTVPENAQEAATQVLPVSGTQPTPMEVDSPNITSNVGRKARIGKSMAREMMYGAHTANLQVFNGHHHHQSQHQHLPSHNSIVVPELNKPVNSSDVIDVTVTVKSEIDQIKKEPIKVEDDDDVVILEQDVNEVKSEPEVVEVSDKSSDVEEITDTNGLATDDSPLPAKRIKILDTKALCKKSPANGYKSLIRQTEPKSYLCLSTKRESRKSHLHKNSKLRSRIRRRKVVLTDEQKERLSIHKRNLMKLGKKQSLLGELKGGGSRTQRRPGAIQSRAVRKVTTFQNRPIDLTGSDADNVAGDTRGYFSEPEIRSSGSRKAGKGRTQETRSRSETKKSQINKVTTNGRRGYEAATVKSAQMPKLPEKFTKPITSSQERRIESATAASRKYQTTTMVTSKNGKKKKSTAKQTATASATWQVSTSGAISDDCNATQPAIDLDPMIGRNRSESTSMVLMDGDSDDEDDIGEPNNNDMATEIAAISSSNCRGNFCGGKRSRARGYRFSSKKRAKNRRYQTEVDNSIIPRKSNAVPKWNNGWSWCGEPFQAKIFLNSDDPLVIRTCYPAMRHVEGDLIRPRDCVLLRAGSKKNELPYVAKVAHLWENPEDGEMMMSLLWYYRPEHTEQGRQDGDCSDEVFASRHRDHNSVACIEDKCYVLTFSEYCRYRRRVRAVEEGIENINRTVPALKIANYSPKVPVITNPEQVMFCQRVYEFRLKRLLKTPTN